MPSVRSHRSVSTPKKNWLYSLASPEPAPTTDASALWVVFGFFLIFFSLYIPSLPMLLPQNLDRYRFLLNAKAPIIGMLSPPALLEAFSSSWVGGCAWGGGYVSWMLPCTGTSTKGTAGARRPWCGSAPYARTPGRVGWSQADVMLCVRPGGSNTIPSPFYMFRPLFWLFVFCFCSFFLIIIFCHSR